VIYSNSIITNCFFRRQKHISEHTKEKFKSKCKIKGPLATGLLNMELTVPKHMLSSDSD